MEFWRIDFNKIFRNSANVGKSKIQDFDDDQSMIFPTVEVAEEPPNTWYVPGETTVLFL